MQQNDFNQTLVFAIAETQNSNPYVLEDDIGYVDCSVVLSAITGVGASLAVSVQVSQDKETWEDRDTVVALTAAGTQYLRVTEPKTYMRFKAVLTGTTPTATVKMFAQGKEGGASDGSVNVPAGNPTCIGKNTGGDFTVAYASATTLTLGTLPDGSALIAAGIVSVIHINNLGSEVARYSRDDTAMTISGGVLTVVGANFSSTDQFVIYTNVAKSATMDTELPAAAALADGAANPTTPTVGADISAYNGTTWDRVRAGITAVGSTFTGMLNSLTWAIFNTTPTTRTNGQGGPLEADALGSLKTSVRAADGTAFDLATAANQTSGNTKLDTIITQTDGIEGSVSSIDTKLTSQATAANQASTNTKLDTLIAQTDGIEASLSAIDAGTPAALGQTTASASQPVVLASDQVSTDTAGADATSNTSTRMNVTAWAKSFNGSTWDRIRSAVVSIGTTFTGFLNVIPIAIFNSSPTTRTNGQGGPLEADASGNLQVNLATRIAGEDQTNNVMGTMPLPLAIGTYAYSTDLSAALEASSLAKNSPGVIMSITGRIDSTHASGTYYLQMLNASSVPADGAVTFLVTPLKIVHVTGTDTAFNMDFKAPNGVFASTGIVWCLSTTEFTKTISGAFVSATLLFK